MKATLSVIIICMNEADRIRACLESVADLADELIVFDSGSTDGTVEICKQYTDKVFETDWPGYGPQKQRALEAATGEWVLSIDADERLSAGLRERIRRVLEADSVTSLCKVKIVAEIYQRVLMHGRTTKYGGRLFRREGARFSDARIHEHVIPAPGPTRTLEEPILHETFRSYEHAMRKLDSYAWTWAVERYGQGRRSSPLRGFVRAVAMFLKCYFYQRGILDGRQGFVIAMQFSIYTFNKYAALWYLGLRGSGDDSDIR